MIGFGFSIPEISVRRSGLDSSNGSSFDFNPLTAVLSLSGDSISALDDDTGFLYWGQALSGGPVRQAPYSIQAVSGSEINEGTPSTNVKDLLYPTRKQLLESAVRSGDIVAVAIGTNTIATGNASTVIAGLTELYAGILDKGAFIEAYTILPSASNIAVADLATVNDWIRALPTTGITYSGTNYPKSKFLVVDGFTAWGGTYVNHTDSGNLHPNTRGAIKIGQARRSAYKAAGRAYHRLYGTTFLTGNLLSNWDLSAGTGGSITANAGNTYINNGVPTGIVVACTANANLTIQTDILPSYSPDDDLYASASAFPTLKLTVSGTTALQADITVTMAQSITSEPAGSAYESFCYAKWKGIGTANPTGLFSLAFGYGSVTKWGAASSPTATGYSNIDIGDEGVLLGRSIPAVQAFGSSSVVLTARVRSGETVSFELYFAQPYAGKSERTAYAIPKSLHTDQDGIGGVRATGPQVGTSNTSFSISNGTALTGRPGLAWFGGGLTFQFTWEKLAVDGTTVSTLAGPTTVTTTASTTQYTPSGFVTGEKARLKVTATNSFGSADAYSVWSNAHA